MNALWFPSIPVWHFILRGFLVYVAILLLLRFSGKRQVGQMGSGEFVALLLLSNAVQNSMNGGDNSVTGGLILAATIIGLSAMIAYLTYRSKRWEALIEGRPALLVYNGVVVAKNMERELLNVHELHVMLRRQGIQHIDEIHQAVLESNGTLSVMKKTEKQPG